MGTMMLPHVYQLSGFSDSAESGFYNRFRRTYKCHHCPVGGLTRVDVKHFDTVANAFATFLYGFNDGFNDFHVAAFAEIRYAFYDSFHMQT